MVSRSSSPHRLGPEWAATLAELPLFAGLSKRHVRRILSLGREDVLGAGATVVREGATSDAFFVILDGCATVRAGGRKVARLGVGDFFGEIGLLDGAPRTATVEAATDVRLFRLDRRAFLRLLESEPKVALRLLATLAARLRAARPSRSD